MSISSCNFSHKSPASPPINYMFQAGTNNLKFQLDDTDISYLPRIEIDGKNVSFLNDSQSNPLVVFNGYSTLSLSHFVRLVDLSDPSNQTLIDKVAMVANFFLRGTQYKIIDNQSFLKGKELSFKVVDEKKFEYLVTIPSIDDTLVPPKKGDAEIEYKLITASEFTNKENL